MEASKQILDQIIKRGISLLLLSSISNGAMELQKLMDLFLQQILV